MYLIIDWALGCFSNTKKYWKDSSDSEREFSVVSINESDEGRISNEDPLLDLAKSNKLKDFEDELSENDSNKGMNLSSWMTYTMGIN